jgi:NAD(P)-dependent dehydrogenase (short-subunit alcohol dehydrogenase family)
VLSAGVDNFEPIDVVAPLTWDALIATNLRGVFLACRALLPQLRRPGGSIVHIASASALVGSPGMAAYSASKGAMVSLAREMAVDFAGDGIRVNSICPGSIDTPMLRAGFDARPDPTAAERACIARHPLGRLGTAEDVAFGALYLASDEAAFVTGSTLVIDGGYTAV